MSETTYAKTQRATIVGVHVGPEDHGIPTCMVYLDCEQFQQGFGGLALDDETLPVFVRDLWAAFGATEHEVLVGKTCDALWTSDRWNAPIDALRGPAGVFDLHAWRQKMHPGLVPSRTEERRRQLRSEIAWAERRLAELRADLAELGPEDPAVRAHMGLPE